MPADRIAGVLLAAGAATRFGADKLAADWNGRTVLQWSTTAMLDAGLDPVLVVVQPGDARPLPNRVRTVANHRWSAGISTSVQTGLAALAGPTGDVDAQLARIAVPTVVVTLGGRGCLARSGQQRLSQPAFAVTPVDTTGAGDTFCGTLVAALSRGLTLAEALRQASAAAALACTKMGAQSSIPTAAEVADFLAQTNPNPTQSP